MRNPAGLTAAVMVLLGVGFGAGLLLGERRQVEERRPAAEERAPTGDPAAAPQVSSTPAGKSADPLTADENSQLRERVRVLEAELRTVRDNPTVAG